jgi:hypothetical protein
MVNGNENVQGRTQVAGSSTVAAGVAHVEMQLAADVRPVVQWNHARLVDHLVAVGAEPLTAPADRVWPAIGAESAIATAEVPSTISDRVTSPPWSMTISTPKSAWHNVVWTFRSAASGLHDI